MKDKTLRRVKIAHKAVQGGASIKAACKAAGTSYESYRKVYPAKAGKGKNNRVANSSAADEIFESQFSARGEFEKMAKTHSSLNDEVRKRVEEAHKLVLKGMAVLGACREAGTSLESYNRVYDKQRKITVDVLVAAGDNAIDEFEFDDDFYAAAGASGTDYFMPIQDTWFGRNAMYAHTEEKMQKELQEACAEADRMREVWGDKMKPEADKLENVAKNKVAMALNKDVLDAADELVEIYCTVLNTTEETVNELKQVVKNDIAEDDEIKSDIVNIINIAAEEGKLCGNVFGGLG